MANVGAAHGVRMGYGVVLLVLPRVGRFHWDWFFFVCLVIVHLFDWTWARWDYLVHISRSGTRSSFISRSRHLSVVNHVGNGLKAFEITADASNVPGLKATVGADQGTI